MCGRIRRPDLRQSILRSNEHASGLLGEPKREAFPAAKLMRPDVIEVVRFRFCDRDRANRMILIRGPSTPKAVAIGLVKTLLN